MRLCHKAARPVRGDIVRTLGVQELNITCGAVCVYPNRVPDAVAALKKIGAGHIPVAAGEVAGRVSICMSQVRCVRRVDTGCSK